MDTAGLNFISYLKCNHNFVDNFKVRQIVSNDMDGLCDSVRLFCIIMVIMLILVELCYKITTF